MAVAVALTEPTPTVIEPSLTKRSEDIASLRILLWDNV